MVKVVCLVMVRDTFEVDVATVGPASTPEAYPSVPDTVHEVTFAALQETTAVPPDFTRDGVAVM
jgi:hypothetical protein